MILSKQKCCLLLAGASTESQKRTSVLQTKRAFYSNKNYDSYKCWTCAELCEAFNFLVENIYVQFECMVYQQIVGIPMGTNCALPIADLFLFCYERDFMSNLHISKQYDLVDMFNDTSRYLDDIFTIDNPEFETYPWYISNGTSVEHCTYFRQRNFFLWFKYKSYWQWCSYQRLRQTRWLRISYCQFPLVEWRCS